MHIQSLGQVGVIVAGQAVKWPSSASRDLLYLLLGKPLGHTKAEIMRALWNAGDTFANDGRFKTTLYRTRQTLNDPAAVTLQGGRYVLADKYHQHADFVMFKRALQRAKSLDGRDERLTSYYQALSLYEGDFLPDHPAEWAEETRDTLRTAHVRARLDVAFLHCDALECQLGIRNLATALATDPLIGENYHQDLMTCLCTVGNRHGAVSHYRHFLNFIQRDIGDTPTAETLNLAERLKHDEPHAARHIGALAPCPRRLLYGVSPQGAPAPHLDPQRFDLELARGKLIVSLLHKLTRIRDWTALARVVQPFVVKHLHTPYARLIPREALSGPAPQDAASGQAELDRAIRAALLSAPPSSTVTIAVDNVAVCAEPIIQGAQGVRAWLCASKLEASALSNHDRELLSRVAGAVAYVLPQLRA